MEIKQQIPVLDVIKVMSDSFDQIGIATKTIDLSPTGDPRFHGVAHIVMWDVVLKIPNQLGALRTRADQAHFAFEHIPELRDLVDVPLPHQCADSKAARVIFCGPADLPVFLRVKSHTANLQHVEGLAIPAQPSLAV